MAEVTFRFYAELNDFLPPARRGGEFGVVCAPTASVKHVIEALGVPHTEVELILVNGVPVRFALRLRGGDRVSVYPCFYALEIPAAWRAGEPVPEPPRFVADAHLGRLARLMRMAGFDTLYRNDYADREIARLAAQHGRVVLTRDRDLLKHRAVGHGCLVHAVQPEQQFGEVVRRFRLAASAQPFTRCLVCNSALRSVACESVRDRLPPSVLARCPRLSLCPDCQRVYWRGTHWLRMRQLLDATLDRPAAN